MNHFHGHLVVEPGTRFAVVIARFNELIGTRLLAGFEDAIVRHGGQNMDIDVFWVPGAFELPLVAKTVAETGRYAAVAALGAVIRGATPHFDFVAAESAKGVQSAMLATGTPIVYATRTGTPRIALVGKQLEVSKPILFMAIASVERLAISR